MRILTLVAAAAAACLPVAAYAQDATSAPADPQAMPATTAPADSGSAPDGTRAFGIVPYAGVMGGYEIFDREAPGHGYNIPQAVYPTTGLPNPNRHLQGGLVQGVAGVNVPVGPVFAGVEGNVAKGFTGNIDWEYGVAGRVGIRAGDSGMVYGKAGYQWVEIDHFAGYTPGGDTGRHYGDWTYGLGVEVGPKDIGLKGLTNNAGIRIRGEVDTYGSFHSVRPMLGIITHF